MSFENYSRRLVRYPEMGFSLDVSLMDLPADFAGEMSEKVRKAFSDLKALEAGEIANPDEGRMVGHYWLRDAELAPSVELKEQITQPLADLKAFAKEVLEGDVKAPGGANFQNLLVVGIGGSALGPQFLYEALGVGSPMKTWFFDNTDPAGMDRVLEEIGTDLDRTLVLVVSKSGGTPETRNGMLEAKAAYEAQGLEFAKHAVAITGEGSKLFHFAQGEGFVTTFPMEDWIGGRTSVMSTVGLVPMALQGIDVDEVLAGAAAMDVETRKEEGNAAMEMALAWYHEGNGKGERDMVVLPYKDSLVLFSKYLQQLVMESLGKEHDLDGNEVHQGIAVYGNKGSTDQHAYVQQLRDGVHNFFATFIEVRKGRDGESVEVEEGVTSADFLQGFLRGTRTALYEKGRRSMTISIGEVTPFMVGALIALFERAVTLYASLVNINAYHQPGVEAGKKAAGVFLELLKSVREALGESGATAAEVAEKLSADEESVYHCLNHLAANGQATLVLGDSAGADQFSRSLS
ncbi:MAG: glucose-6-phosphate isomerase [Verrucomicrobiota bacterium]